MSGWANIDYGGDDPRFGDYYGAGYSGYDSQPFLGYYGGYNAGSYAYPSMPPEEYGGYGAQRYAYPNVGSPFGTGFYGTDQYGYPYYGSGYGIPPYAGNPTPSYPGFGPTTGYGRQTSGYLRGQEPTNRRQSAGQSQSQSQSSGRQGVRYQHQRPSWQQGPHAGKGPKRADNRIQDEVAQRLTQHGHLDASDIEVTVDNGAVTLTGTVDSRQAKREAERVADAVPGVQDVHNQLTVQQGQGASRQAASASAASSTPQSQTIAARRAPRGGSRASSSPSSGQQTDLPATIDESPPMVVAAPGATGNQAAGQSGSSSSGAGSSQASQSKPKQQASGR